MPAQPEATVTHPESPFPPADPLPYGVAPAVTDPVSNPDFVPVDDAFALELRAESIEQLSGGDALRRGESERIEAGRSETNADLVAGRDRVRVHGALLEHTGHGLAEQAAHLHTTVEGRLDVHAASEDTVLLAGHMSDLWDGGTAIVAAMSDDTVAGGGIRVTAPLDLWVHGLMGVEERIGTCTADAVLMELSRNALRARVRPRGACGGARGVHRLAVPVEPQHVPAADAGVERGAQPHRRGRGWRRWRRRKRSECSCRIIAAGAGEDRCGGGGRHRDARRGAQSRRGAGERSRYRRWTHRRSASTPRRARELGRRTGGPKRWARPAP